MLTLREISDRIEIDDLAGMNRQTTPDRNGKEGPSHSFALSMLRRQPHLDRRPVPWRTGALHDAVREIRSVCFGARRNRCQREHRYGNDCFSNLHEAPLRLVHGQNDDTHLSCTEIDRDHGVLMKVTDG